MALTLARPRRQRLRRPPSRSVVIPRTRVTPIGEVFLTLKLLRPGDDEGGAGWAMAGLGLRTALDMQLLGGGPEAEELMDQLKVAVGMCHVVSCVTLHAETQLPGTRYPLFSCDRHALLNKCGAADFDKNAHIG